MTSCTDIAIHGQLPFHGEGRMAVFKCKHQCQ